MGNNKMSFEIGDTVKFKSGDTTFAGFIAPKSFIEKHMTDENLLRVILTKQKRETRNVHYSHFTQSRIVITEKIIKYQTDWRFTPERWRDV